MKSQLLLMNRVQSLSELWSLCSHVRPESEVSTRRLYRDKTLLYTFNYLFHLVSLEHSEYSAKPNLESHAQDNGQANRAKSGCGSQILRTLQQETFRPPPTVIYSRRKVARRCEY
jgi:hypothetical protein